MQVGKSLLKLFTTYTWSFLAILILITATVALDPLDRNVRPDACDTDEPLFTCDSVHVNKSTGRLDIHMQNNDFETSVIEDVQLVSMNNEIIQHTCQQSSRLVREDSSITISCYDLPVSDGQNTVKLSYYVYDARQGRSVGQDAHILIRETLNPG